MIYIENREKAKEIIRRYQHCGICDNCGLRAEGYKCSAVYEAAKQYIETHPINNPEYRVKSEYLNLWGLTEDHPETNHKEIAWFAREFGKSAEELMEQVKQIEGEA